MKHEITLGNKGKACLKQNISIGTNRIVMFQTHLLWPYMVLCGHLFTKDDIDQLQCVIGYTASLYLEMYSSMTIAWTNHCVMGCTALSRGTIAIIMQ